MENIQKVSLLFILSLLISSFQNIQGKEHKIEFKSLPPYINIPTDVQQIYQDRDGFIWFATRNGVCRFDGYELEIIKSNLYTPGALSSNDILAIQEDYQHRLWIGTSYGLNMLDKKSGKIQKEFGALNNERVQSILITKDNTIWLGTGSSLYKSNNDPEQSNTSISFTKVRSMDVKSLVEAPNNQIWIGTWSDGLYRYITATDSLVSYPAINPLNSAYFLFQDSKEQIWIGTWGYGLYKLHHPYDQEKAYFEKFAHEEGNSNSLIHNLIYSISEDSSTGNLWIGTLEGLSCFNGKDFLNYTPNIPSNGLPYNEIISIFRDRTGTMWLGFLGGRVYWVRPQNLQFNLHQLSHASVGTACSNIQGLTVYKNDLWIGLEKHSFIIHDRTTNSNSKREKAFNPSILQSEYTYYSFLKPRHKDELWLGSYGNGVYIYHPEESGKPLSNMRSPEIPHFPNFIYCMFEDNRQNVYLGSTTGLSILTKEGKFYHYNNLLSPQGQYSHSVYSITQDSLNNIWIGTDHSGIFRINPTQDLSNCTFSSYSINNNKINSNEIQCIFVNKEGNILAGTDGGGLNLYAPHLDSFISIHTQYNIPGDMICSILEDKQQNLWMGSNVGLIKLNLKDSIAESKCRLYTTSDGLQDNKFARGAACQAEDGEMFFGGPQGYNSFYPEKLTADELQPDIFITDIQVQNKSVKDLPAKDKLNIMSDLAPGYAQTLHLNYKQNDFTCKLSVLNFYNPEKNEYAYRLDGLDHTWQYTTDRSNIISYSNLESRTYTLYIKGTNGNGKWSKVEKALTIIITPPWWSSTWAYIAYAIFLIAVIAYTIHLIRKRIRLKNTLRIKEVEQRKQEELNRAKLQFFTNITHELLTPLTIISVTLNEIKSIAPQISDYYSIMDNNINRLKRLLQQILEFRKAESGNLKLKVSQGNIASFIRKSVDSFLPLLRNKKMQLDMSIEQEEIIGYFDPDKVDKILYNLLSNAFKYNREGKTIRVNVSYGSSKREIIISVSDNGEGISKENLSKLFNRFYEGDYRKYHTTGHGIGLSLTKELAVLHHGKIEVESQINEGTTFRVTLPIIEEEFTEEEIDRSILPLPETVSDSLSVISSLNKEETIEITEKIDKKKLLLVEDNEDLLKVMADSLSREYHIIKATNGKEAIEQLEKTKDIVVVISDVMMPVMNGIELCHYMKKQDEWLHIPIILLTAKSSESDIIEGYEAGADDYITKPFQLTLLLVKIKSLLKNKENLLKNYSNIIAFEMQKPNIDSADKEFLQQAINCVYEHLDDIKFDQQAFADAMRVSKSTLYRKLKSLSNEGPSVFISDIRLQTAYKILSDNPSMRISDLAYTVGYNDPKYFSSCFKKKFKVLPRDISQE